MRNHTKVYLQFLGLYGFDAEHLPFIPCEYEGCNSRAVDINHLIPRGMGGSKTKDYIENLMGLCREHHELFERNKSLQPHFKEMHLKFIKDFKDGKTII